MNTAPILTGMVLEEAHLSIEDLARACAVETAWIVEHVEAGLLEPLTDQTNAPIGPWQFASAHLSRARHLVELEARFEANPELAALVVDLIEELRELKRRLAVAGLT